MLSTYPVRTSKEKYTIPLIRRHECSMECYVCIYEDEATGQIQIQPNPNFIDGHCESSESYEWTLAHIVDTANWREIERLNEVVVPDSSFTFTLNFPLQHPRTITVHSRGEGFTRQDVLTIIRSFYSETYTTESDTATQHTVEITTPCIKCTVTSIENELKNEDNPPENETCCICIDTIATECCKLPCNHYYHFDCIRGWISAGKTTCPMCRKEILECSDCDGTKSVTSTYSAAVPERSSVPFGRRLLTDGRYGLHNYYLEDLALQGMVYNRREKRLIIEVCPMYQ